MFDVTIVVLLQMNQNHLHVSLMKGLTIIFQGLCMYKTEVLFLVKSCMLQRKKFIAS